MVGNVTIQGQIVGTATFDGAKISAVVTIAPPINATVVFGKSGVTIHNLLAGRDAEDAHPIEAITGLTEVLEAIPTPLGFTPENVSSKKTTLTNSETDYPSTSAVNRLTELDQTDSPEFANTQITTLKDATSGGVIPNSEATWLGATAKSVLSYLQKLVSKVYAINSRVEVLENNVIFDITTTQDVVSVIITTDKNGNQLNLTEGTYSLSRYSYNGNNNGGGNMSSVLINDINSDVYKQVYAAAGYNGINHKGGNIYSEFEIKLTLKNGVLSWTGLTWGYDTPLGSIGTTTSYGVSIKTLISIPYINKLTVKDQNSSLLIKSGTRFVLKKVN